MAKIVSNFFISLDGVVESPHEWHFPYFNDEMGKAVGQGMETARAWLLGRRLYQEWAAYWPNQPETEPFAQFINQVPKYVVSTSLTNPSWQSTTVVSGDVAGRLRELKEKTAGDIGISGSATLVRWLLAHDLLDELHLLIHPIAVGHGQRLFEETPTYPLHLLHQEVFSTGVLHVVYAPAAR